jgi:N-acyl-D-amino-acid deacylase
MVGEVFSMKRYVRRTCIALATLTGLACVAAGRADAAKAKDVDLLIAGGLVYAGDLKPARTADIGIDGDRIVFIGNAAKSGVRGRRTIAAKGMMVAPGFIDPHTHTEDELTSPDAGRRLVLRQLLQGVTTSVIGVDGDGTPHLRALIDKAQAAGIGQNFAAYVGFGTVRQMVVGEDARAPTAEELARMKALTAAGMCEGALGLSSGLFYAPQSFATTEEVIAIAGEAGRRGGIYDTHQRDEGDSNVGVVASMTEALRIGAESGATLHIGHIKISGGWKPDGAFMAELVGMVEAARAKGQKVTADQYPWGAASTSLDAAIIPRWAQDGGRAAMLKRFDDPADAPRIKAESAADRLADRIVINHYPSQPDLVGKPLSEIAAGWSVTPAEAAIRILHKGEAGVAVFVMNEPDIKKAMIQPWVMTSSDGGDGGHPRGYASYPRLWTNYVVDQKVLTPVQFVHRSTGLVADSLGISQRGYLRTGYFADIVVIDPKRYKPMATFAEPRLLSTGVIDAVVNGQVELANGEPTGIMSGRGLAKTAPAGTCP